MAVIDQPMPAGWATNRAAIMIAIDDSGAHGEDYAYKQNNFMCSVAGLLSS